MIRHYVIRDCLSRGLARSHADHHVSSAHGQFGKCVCRFVAREILPYHAAREEAGVVPREAWRQAGEAGLLVCNVLGEQDG